MRAGVAALGAVLVAAPALAQTPVLSAPDAAARLAKGEMVLLDIRSKEEWAETGLAQGAWPVSMHEKGFVGTLQQILAIYPPDQIGLICATGGRSSHVASVLEKNGISGVWDVSEGMNGNRRGPGWIARGMDVQSVDAAQGALEAALSAR